MITIRPSGERGHFDFGWLDTHHTFSFADYHDPDHMQFRALRVINEDRVQAGRGFGTHPHRDMEIITYVLSGALQHKDSMGTGSIIRPGEVQRMTAGTGVTHSEFNASKTDSVHLLQIWIVPERARLTPSYEQKSFAESPAADERHNRLRLVAAPDGRDGAVTLHQAASIYAAVLDANIAVEHVLEAGRYAWVQLVRGAVTVNDQALRAGDGAALESEARVAIRASEPAELLLFDLS